MKIWDCKIGECDDALLPQGSDGPMRDAVSAAYRALTGTDPAFLFSGWGAELSEGERAVVENRMPEPVATAAEAVPVLVSCLNSDPDYAWGWHCNVAMAAFDEGLDRAAANRAAGRFMALLGCNTANHERFAETQP